MTIREASKGVVTSGRGTYNIGFNDGDETQFNVQNLEELQECWSEFCMRRLRGKGELVEVLTRAIANEYRDRALLLPSNGLQDIGERRKLREELQTRCNLTELQAVNVINGFHIPDYVRIAEVRAAKEAVNNG